MQSIKRSELRREFMCGVRLTEKEYNELRKLSCESGFTMSSYAREIIMAHIREQHTERK